ncbi:MAG: thiamine pyrophosphate-binding protein [Candidatus Hydrogenedentota bacterium]|nr:MAG: thiamine pyrophosphate-binding protein [Candidatus Hydrogenedentota bacterium]
MKKTGAWLAAYALEQIGVKYTFGIPGVHNTELYDALNNLDSLEPILVTHEGGGSFMADAISRTTNSIGTLAIVPAAGLTHAMSGIGESYLDGIPMLIISGGTRTDSGRYFQLHQIDQVKVADGITKAAFKVTNHNEIVPTIYKAYEIAMTGCPGPVLVEIPVNLQLFQGEVKDLPKFDPSVLEQKKPAINDQEIDQAVEILMNAKRPGIYVGWGAVDAVEITKEIAELLEAPVATTLQGLSAFPADHPLHTGYNFSSCSVPASEKAFADVDAMLAVGVRFAELATVSYSVNPPKNLIHIDIDPEVPNKNYPAKVAIIADARDAMSAILQKLKEKNHQKSKATQGLRELIAKEKKAYRQEWTAKKQKDKVSPGHFFEKLRKILDRDSYLVVDDGNHTFLTAELFDVYEPRHFISPTDFNCMGYAVPAAIGVKLSHPDKQVVSVVGDGAFLMTCMEILTASTHNLGVVYFVFHDGELAQISQLQQVPLNRKTCTILGDIKLSGIALATGAEYMEMSNDDQVEQVIHDALKTAERGQPVIVDVKIDYSKKTKLTKGAVKVNLGRFPLGEKVRFIGRAIVRHVFQ